MSFSYRGKCINCGQIVVVNDYDVGPDGLGDHEMNEAHPDWNAEDARICGGAIPCGPVEKIIESNLEI